MAKFSRAKNPFTPNVRQFLFDVFKPTPSLGKRARDDDDEDSARHSTGLSNATSSAASTSHPACVALQNEDTDEDAIVITALNVIPFCCHADLLSMSRTHLLAVANMLNTKLPRALQIDVSPGRSDVFIRNSIELLVGLRHNVPQAPKPERCLSLATGPHRRVPASPASPLAARSRSNLSFGSPMLAMLREEDETDPGVEPPQKRRRVQGPESPRLDYARRITRSQSHRVAPMYTAPGFSTPTRAQGSARVLRTRSQRLPERTPVLQGVPPNVTVARGRTAAARPTSAVLTSTPKKRKVLGDADSVNSLASLAAVAAATLTPKTSRAMSTPRGKKRGALARKKVAEYSSDATELTFGIDGMTMAVASGSDIGAD